MPVQFERSSCRSIRSIPTSQDALDLIEFANGPVTSAWGKKARGPGASRALQSEAHGRRQRAVGTLQYIERYELFAKVLSRSIRRSGSCRASARSRQGKGFRLSVGPAARTEGGARRRALLHAAELVPDEHQPLRQLSAHPDRKCSPGEYAAHAPSIPARGQRPSTLTTALAEAAFMTGLERNADVVSCRRTRRSSRTSMRGRKWTPNLIWFDNLKSYGTARATTCRSCSARNRGTHVLPVNKPEEGEKGCSPARRSTEGRRGDRQARESRRLGAEREGGSRRASAHRAPARRSS